MLIEDLRAALDEFFKSKSFPNLNIEFRSRLIKNGLGFFPYGSGVLTNTNKIPENCYLFLGHDFGSVEYANSIMQSGEENKTTLRILLKELISRELKGEVFLSNIFMGLREGEKSNIKKFAAFENKEYKQLCKNFLEFQIESIKPFRIITLEQSQKSLFKKI